jgi:hypothetical protein
VKRTLTLRREPLVELATGELTAVVGGAPPTLQVGDCLQKYLNTIEPTRCMCP